MSKFTGSVVVIILGLAFLAWGIYGVMPQVKAEMQEKAEIQATEITDQEVARLEKKIDRLYENIEKLRKELVQERGTVSALISEVRRLYASLPEEKSHGKKE